MIRSLLLQGERLRSGLSPEEIASVLADKSCLLWVDLTPDGESDINFLTEVFGFHPLAVEDCFNGRVNTPKIDDYGDYLFIISQSVVYSGRSERIDLAELDLFLGPNYVVTSRTSPIASVDELFERASENLHFLSRGADFLAHTILDSVVDLLLPAVEAMDDDLADLEQRILDRPERALLQEALLLKRNTLRLRRSILPQRDLINRLSRGEFDLIRNEALIFYRDVYDHIVRVEEMLDGIRDLADSALSSYLSAVNNRMNEVMKAMSVVAVIFLPLTLIASIFGTNLDYNPWGLPGFEGGFLLLLGIMVTLATLMVVYFHKRGWF